MIMQIFSAFMFFMAAAAFGQNPTGHPGVVPNWSSAKKVQVGTSNTFTKQLEKSLVWFTNAHGVLT